MLPIRVLCVCLSATFVYCAQTAEDIDTISFVCDSPVSLADNLAYIDQHLHPQILSESDPLPVDLSVRDIRWKIAAE